MKFVATFLVFLVALSVGATAFLTSDMRMEVGLSRSSHWQRVGRANPNDRLELTIAVRQSNVDLLEEKLLSVSDPRSPAYGRHLSREEVASLTAPSEESILRVKEWLSQNVIVPSFSSMNQDFITAEVTVAQAEVLLNTEYSYFVHSSTGQRVTRVDGLYHIPSSLKEHVDFVSPTMRFPSPKTPTLRGKFFFLFDF